MEALMTNSKPTAEIRVKKMTKLEKQNLLLKMLGVQRQGQPNQTGKNKQQYKCQ